MCEFQKNDLVVNRMCSPLSIQLVFLESRILLLFKNEIEDGKTELRLVIAKIDETILIIDESSS